MENKTCPRCKENKLVSEYHVYFSRERGKNRIANYCKPCAKIVSCKNAKKNYQENKDKKLEYAKEYRKKNACRIKKQRPIYKKKQIEELQNCYVRELLTTKNGVDPNFIQDNPEILQTKRIQLKIKRKLKSFKNGKK